MRPSGRGKLWIAWCILLAMFAAGGAYTFLRWSNVPHGAAALVGAFVLYSAGYFLIRGAEAHEREAQKKRRSPQ